MQIQTVNFINFIGKTKPPVQNKLYKPNKDASRTHIDTFVRENSAILKNLKSVKITEFLNKGQTATVYKTNFEGYLVRLKNNSEFNAQTLTPVKDKNGIIIAANENYTIQLMKHINGEPLYGYNWNIDKPTDKDEYLRTFNIIKNLPDESFSEYIRKIINIRKNGYDIDSINPNNILLDGTHLNIVDFHRNSLLPHCIFFSDFDPLVNHFYIHNLLHKMKKNEIDKFADEIKILYDRIMSIATKEGNNRLDKNTIPYYSPIYALYFKDWDELGKYLEQK